MKIELEIVTDGSLPTEADGNDRGNVVVTDFDTWKAWHWSNVKPGMRWAKIPSPPKPPIDTSLAADCDDLERFVKNTCLAINQNKVIRVIEAARKWDETFCKVDVGDHDSINTDPDGVGEGWRLLREGEPRVEGYEYKLWVDNEWTIGAPEHYGKPITTFDLNAYIYRRRIGDHDSTNTDPDGVGEGWERCSRDEALEYRWKGKTGWCGNTTMPPDDSPLLEFRRRIEAEK